MNARLIPVFALLFAGSLTVWGYMLILNGMQRAAKAAIAPLSAPGGAVNQYLNNQGAAVNLAGAGIPSAPAPLAVGPPAPATSPAPMVVPLGPCYAPQYDRAVGPREWPRDIRSGL